MFDVLFATFGPLGSAALLLGMVSVFFAVAAAETLGAARAVPVNHSSELAGTWGRIAGLGWVAPLRRMIARPARARDSRACHAWTAHHCVRGERARERIRG